MNASFVFAGPAFFLLRNLRNCRIITLFYKGLSVKNIIFLFFFVAFSSLFFACSNNVSNNSVNLNSVVKTPSIVGKWYYNSEDDRYYYQFYSDGRMSHRYYQDLGSIGGGLNAFVTQPGSWGYENDNKTKFWVAMRGNIACYYDILYEDDEKLVIKKDSSRSAGLGLGSVTNLLKSAKKVSD